MKRDNEKQSNTRSDILKRLYSRAALTPFSSRPPTTMREGDWLRSQEAGRGPQSAEVNEEKLCRRLSESGVEIIRAERPLDIAPKLVPWLVREGVESLLFNAGSRLERLIQSLLLNEGILPIPARHDAGDVFQADAGIALARAAICDTGSLIFYSSVRESRLITLAPERLIVFLRRDAIFPDLLNYFSTDLFQREIPSSMYMVSGISKTSDIEGQLIEGIHGPKKILLCLVDKEDQLRDE